MRRSRQTEELKLELLRKEIDRGFRDVGASRFSNRSIAEIARSVLDELEESAPIDEKR